MDFISLVIPALIFTRTSRITPWQRENIKIENNQIIKYFSPFIENILQSFGFELECDLNCGSTESPIARVTSPRSTNKCGSSWQEEAWAADAWALLVGVGLVGLGVCGGVGGVGGGRRFSWWTRGAAHLMISVKIDHNELTIVMRGWWCTWWLIRPQGPKNDDIIRLWGEGSDRGHHASQLGGVDTARAGAREVPAHSGWSTSNVIISISSDQLHNCFY